MPGVLLDELGLTEGLIEPLVRDWLQPLCAKLAPLARQAAALTPTKSTSPLRDSLSERRLLPSWIRKRISGASAEGAAAAATAMVMVAGRGGETL